MREARLYLYKGKSKSVPDWAAETGLSKQLIYHRLVQLGWTIDRALGTPVGRPRGKSVRLSNTARAERLLRKITRKQSDLKILKAQLADLKRQYRECFA